MGYIVITDGTPSAPIYKIVTALPMTRRRFHNEIMLKSVIMDIYPKSIPDEVIIEAIINKKRAHQELVKGKTVCRFRNKKRFKNTILFHLGELEMKPAPTL